MGAALTDHLARAITGVRVVTARDISVLLGFERQKQLLGCSDDGMCMAELGNALGVQGVLSELRVGDFRRAHPRWQVIAPTVPHGDGPATRARCRRRHPRRQPRFFPVPLAIGGVSLAAGFVFLGLSQLAWSTLTAGGQGSLALTQAEGIARDGKTFQLLSATFLTVGAAAAIAGFGLLVFGSEPSAPSASIALSSNGFVVTGSF